MSARQAIAEVYDQAEYSLRSFYNTRYESDEVLHLSGQIGDAHTKLLDMLVNLLNLHWFQLPKRIKMITQIRKKIVGLRLLSLHSSQSNDLRNDIAEPDQEVFRDSALHEASREKIANEALAKLYWKDHTRVADIDATSILIAIEHVRSEIQVIKNLSVTFWAALAGAIVGAILTVLGSNLHALAKLITPS